MTQKLLFGNTEIATPTDLSIRHEKVLSNNAGVTSTCMYVADVKGIETTIHLEWAGLKPSEVAVINSFILDVGSLFFPVTYLDEEYKEVTRNVKADSPSYEQWGWDTKRQLVKVLTLDLVAYTGN